MKVQHHELVYASKKNPDGVIRLAKFMKCHEEGATIRDTVSKVSREIERLSVVDLRNRFLRTKA